MDPQPSKVRQRSGWNAAAVGYNRWWAIFEESLQPVSDRMIELAGIRQGYRVLDVATGVGEPAISVGRMVGGAGRVIGIDIAQSMLAFASDRARGLGLQNVTFYEMDAELLGFPAASFDAILCRYGLMFFPNMTGAFQEMRRCLVPGGRLVVAVQRSADSSPAAFGLAMQIAQAEVRGSRLDEGGPHLFRLTDANYLLGALEAGGFRGGRTELLRCAYRWTSTTEYVAMLREVADPVNSLLADLPHARREAIWAKITVAAEEYSSVDGAVVMPHEALLASAER